MGSDTCGLYRITIKRSKVFYKTDDFVSNSVCFLKVICDFKFPRHENPFTLEFL